MTENYNPETRRTGREGAKTAETVLLTGGTGFLGTEMASRLAGRDGVLTYVLVRAADEEEAYHSRKQTGLMGLDVPRSAAV